MKFGISTYSLAGAIRSGEMNIADVIHFIAEIGGEHVEIVPIGYNLTEDPGLIEVITSQAAAAGIDVSNYAISANFLTEDEAALALEIERVKHEVDIAARLGVSFMRHDVASSPDVSIAHFNAALPQLAAACRTIADYAAGFGITTSVENHGYFIQNSDRVQALIQAVDRANFKTTLDIGNFMCADEDSPAAVRNNLPFASVVHFKDFYLRPSYQNPGEGWFRTTAGNYLRGAIVGQGDIDMREVIRLVKDSGYDGYVSLEFEGLEECKQGTRIGLDNLRRIWQEV
ncbi:sugar phosphate isomerase/epimerase [Paenibacillus sp. S150]|uniref:sugar phosphate isomerase/epimerase family protein n=1 Tax=Paenibacillus sp. S150 TaxID=2749826 RepID=UPI001C563AA7|nr:sugar phosphate isomerase/epimerase family protein [Paenibacillus sp. S150]MBW4083139.1 sugar phosphate isomerase/epimerase [Paenibacillus sp. S150]